MVLCAKREDGHILKMKGNHVMGRKISYVPKRYVIWEEFSIYNTR